MNKKYTDIELNKILQDCTTNTVEPFDTLILAMVNRLVHIPTSDEVCVALGEYLEVKVEYDIEDNMFYSEGVWGISLCGKNIDFDDLSLPPHLITMIGKFYEEATE